MSIKKTIYKFIKIFIPRNILFNYQYKVVARRTIKQWEEDGKPIPPPDSVKQLIITEYQKKYKTDTLVETGTFLGAMIYAQRKHFKEIHTIELSKEYYKKAVENFKKYSHIHPHEGESPDVLKDVVPKLKGRAIFWLDAHYSVDIFARGKSDCPIFEELDVIFLNNKQKHIILIDDAREFIGVGDYPTNQAVIDYFKKKEGNYTVKIENDIFKCTPA